MFFENCVDSDVAIKIKTSRILALKDESIHALDLIEMGLFKWITMNYIGG